MSFLVFRLRFSVWEDPSSTAKIYVGVKLVFHIKCLLTQHDKKQINAVLRAQHYLNTAGLNEVQMKSRSFYRKIYYKV